MTWTEPIPAAIEKVEALLNRGPRPQCFGHDEGPVFEQHTDECRKWYEDGQRAAELTPVEVALAKALWEVQHEEGIPAGPGLPPAWEHAEAALRAFMEKVEAL